MIMTEHRDIAVFGEVKQGKLAPITTEGLGVGRKLADDSGEQLAAVLVGDGVSAAAQETIAYGADKVYVVDNPLLKDYQADAYIAVMEQVLSQVMPQVLILGQTDIGRDLAPGLAFKLGTAANLDCIELGIDADSRRLLQTKPVYGGNANAVYVTGTDPQIVTIRTKAMTPLEPDASRQGKVINIDVEIDESVIRTKIVDSVVEEVSGVRVEDADVVIAGGRGIGGSEGFAQLEELARLFKGAVGASRPPCDNGWIADTVQIGLTGKIIAPELYIAIGISGSSQHISGCSGAKNIIAINKDPEANIFRQARFGVVGDWKKVLPAFTEKVKELLAS
jgi:electron transfer flavoprotein alpha subunit